MLSKLNSYSLVILQNNMINRKLQTKHNNELIDLSERRVGFYVDHLYRVPNSRVLVFFPYDIDVEQLTKLNEYCGSQDYQVVLIGGESAYGGKSDFTNGTMTVVLTHKDDNYPKTKLLGLIDRLNVIDDSTIRTAQEDARTFNNMSHEEIMKYWDSK